MKYKYKARKSPTEMVEGAVDAASQDEAIERINQMGLMPVDVEKVLEKQSFGKKGKTRKVRVHRKRAQFKDVTVFYKQLARLLKSGVPILSALGLLGSQSESESIRQIVQKVREDVREGQSLSAALSPFGKEFLPLELALIKAGESVGKLEACLETLAEYRAKQSALVSKVRSAVAYPAFVFVAGLGTVFFMLTSIIPKFSMMFADVGQELPWITRMLMAVSQFLEVGWVFVLLAAAALVILTRTAMKREQNMIKWHRWMLSLPLVGKVLLMNEVARFSRTLELLIKNGISLLQGIEIAVPVVGNLALRQELQGCIKELEEGGYFSDALKASDKFPVFVIQLIRIGEESGKLDETLADIADWYEQETTEAVKIMTELLEPVIILIVGLIIGFIIVATLLPVFSMNAMVA